jgi:hypothetical protein
VLARWCCTCKDDDESVDHFFIHCRAARVFWSLVFRSVGIDWVLPNRISDLLFAGGIGLGRVLQVCGI